MKFLFAAILVSLFISCESPTMRTGEPGCVYRDVTGQDESEGTGTVTVIITIQ